MNFYTLSVYIYAAARVPAQPGQAVGVVDLHKKRNFFKQLFVQFAMLTFSQNCGIIMTQRAREGKARSEAHESRVRPSPQDPYRTESCCAEYKCEPSG